MSKLDFAKILKDVKYITAKHSPEILTGIGIAGMITTTILAVKATPKALQLIEEKEDELELDIDEKLTVVETVKATWKCYIPAAITGVTSVACLIGANSVNARRNAALATAYNLSATALSEYKEKVIETIGEKKEQAIQAKVSEDKLKKDPVDRNVVIVTGDGHTRFYDEFTQRRFESDVQTVKTAINELNARMIEGEDYISLNDFYDELGLSRCGFGDDLGWNISKYGRREGMIQVRYDAIMDTDGVPCLVLVFTVAPRRDYM